MTLSSSMCAAPILLSLAILVGCIGSADESKYQPQPGDVLFQDHPSTQSMAVKLATGSEYTHCGVLFQVNGKFVVYEATQPVIVTPLDVWIAKGVDSHFVARRLQHSADYLTNEALESMRAIGEKHLGKDYDLVFNWSDDKLYCSELVWKIYHDGLGVDLSSLRKLAEYDLNHPAVQMKMKERYGNDVPYDEPVVAPSDLFETNRMTTIFSN